MPDVALVCAEQADRQGNLYTGPNTEDTPTIVEATAFHDGVVVVQVNEIVDELPRVDIPASWVDVVVTADRPFEVEPLFTRDPRLISEVQILIAMLVIRGIYERHGVTTLNHGIGFDTAAIELLLPTYGEKLGLRGKICRNWVLNPHPTLIPAIESGWVESVVCFGSEVGMADYTRARPDVFFTGHDGSLRSNRVLAQLAGQYAVDLFIGSTLQMDGEGNSSTVTQGRLAGFGGAPNMGSDARGRRHASAAWLDMITRQERHRAGPQARGPGGRDLPQGRATVDRRHAGRRRGRQEGGNADRAGDDLRRRRHPRRDRGRHRLSLQDRQPGGTQGGHRGDCRRHRGRPASRPRAHRRAALARHRGDSRGPGHPSDRRPPDSVGRAQYRRPRGLVRRALSTACQISELVNRHESTPRYDRLGRSRCRGSTGAICSRLICQLWPFPSLIEEAELTPKPALVDRRGNGAHHDLDLARLRRSARSLQDGFAAIARAAACREAVAAAARTDRTDRPRHGAAHAGGDRWQQRTPRRDLGARLAGRRCRPAPVGDEMPRASRPRRPLSHGCRTGLPTAARRATASGPACDSARPVLAARRRRPSRMRSTSACRRSARRVAVGCLKTVRDSMPSWPSCPALTIPACSIAAASPALETAKAGARAVLAAGGTATPAGIGAPAPAACRAHGAVGLAGRQRRPAGGHPVSRSTGASDRGPSARNRSPVMETLNYEYEAKGPLTRRAHVGVVGSGDLEVLIEPSNSPTTQVRVRTSVDGYAQVWKAVLDRFFSRFDSAAKVEINDFGATPGTVTLRLEQAAEEVRS